jgi:hypothetical protein
VGRAGCGEGEGLVWGWGVVRSAHCWVLRERARDADPGSLVAVLLWWRVWLMCCCGGAAGGVGLVVGWFPWALRSASRVSVCLL